MKLRPYQQQAIDSILYEIEMEGKNNIALEAPTSFGKSIVIAELARQSKKKVVILLNITSLIDQIARHLDELNVDYSILKAGYEDKFDPKKDIQIVMSQTYYSRHKDINFGKVYMICQDEIHREAWTERTMRALNKLKPEVRVGFSATPYDANGYMLEGFDIVRTTTVKELTDNGFLAPLKYYVPKWAQTKDYSEVGRSGADYSSVELDKVINTPEYIEMVVKSMNQMNAKEKKTLVFANSIEHCEAITKALREDGYSAFAYHSKNEPEMALKALNSFKKGKATTEGLFDDSRPIMCLVSMNKLSIGFDVPDCQLGVLCRPTKVKSLATQLIGRIIRPHPNKEYGEILDLAQVIQNHGFADEPYNPPEKGDRNALVEEKKKLECDVGVVLYSEEPVEVSREIVNAKIEEIERKLTDNPQELKLEDLTAYYDSTNSVLTAVELFLEIAKRVRSYFYRPRDIDFIAEPWLKAMAEYPESQAMLFKAMKTRGRNILLQGKKPKSLHYFAQWFIENSPYLRTTPKQSSDDDELEDLSIPF